MNKNSFEFMLKFNGTALDTHCMDASHLANSLLALSNIFDELNINNNPNSVKVNLKIHALKQGSFGVDFLLEQNIFDQFVSLLSSNPATAMCNAYTLVHMFIDTCKFSKLIQGRKIESVTPDNNSGSVNVVVGDNSYVTTINVYHAYQNPRIQTATKQFLEPLKTNGIDSVSFIDGKNVDEFSKEDAEKITASRADQPLSQNKFEKYITVETASFKGGKWRISLGEKLSVFASIKDEQFLKRINDGTESFAKNDIFHVELIETQTITEGKLVTTYEITKVIRHKHGPKQLNLGLE